MGSGTIPNSDITASSEQSASTPAINGRLNYTSGSSWCARTSDTNPYLQIDLQAIYIICAVSTQYIECLTGKISLVLRIVDLNSI